MTQKLESVIVTNDQWHQGDNSAKTDHFVATKEVFSVGLGRDAVRRELQRADNLVDGHPSMDYMYVDNVADSLDDARVILKNLTPAQRNKFNEYIATQPMGKWLDGQFADNDTQTDEPKDYVAAMTELKPDEDDANEFNYEYVVDNAQFMNFLEWHNFNLQRTQKDFAPKVEAYKRDFLGVFAKYVAKGVIPAWVGESVKDRIMAVDVAKDDGFNTHYGRQGDDAYAPIGLAARSQSEKDEVLLGSNLDESRTRRTIFHEFIHTLDGHESGNRLSQEYGLTRLFEESSSREIAGNALNEAIVEHLADTMHNESSIDVIDPTHRSRKAAVYPKERYLLHVLTKMGVREIDVRHCVAAHFDDGKHRDEKGLTPIERLKQEIIEAFPGEDIIGDLAQCEDTEEVHEYTSILRERAPNGAHTRDEKRLMRKADRHAGAEKLAQSLRSKRVLGAAATLLALTATSTGIVIGNMINHDDTRTPDAPSSVTYEDSGPSVDSGMIAPDTGTTTGSTGNISAVPHIDSYSQGTVIKIPSRPVQSNNSTTSSSTRG